MVCRARDRVCAYPRDSAGMIVLIVVSPDRNQFWMGFASLPSPSSCSRLDRQVYSIGQCFGDQGPSACIGPFFSSSVLRMIGIRCGIDIVVCYARKSTLRVFVLAIPPARYRQCPAWRVEKAGITGYQCDWASVNLVAENGWVPLQDCEIRNTTDYTDPGSFHPGKPILLSDF